MKSSDHFELEYSEERYYLDDKILNYSFLFFTVFFLPIFCFLLYGTKYIPNCAFIVALINGLFICLVFIPYKIKTERARKPYIMSKVSITNESFCIYIQNRLYTQIFWKNIKKIEIFKHSLNYKVKFAINGGESCIRLPFIVRSFKKQKLIVNELKDLATENDITIKDINIKKKKREELELDSQYYRDLKQFVKREIESQSLKNLKKKKKKLKRLIRGS